MTVTEILGWAGTVTAVVLGLPQLVRLLRTRNVEGLSLPAWQAFLAVNLGWTAHGIAIGQAPQIVASALSLLSTVPILYLMSRQLSRNLLRTLAPGLGLAAAMILIDQFFGSGAYGAIAIIPAVLANAGQSVALVRDRHVGGVSVLFLILAVINQVLWLIWALLVPDTGTIIAATTTGVIALFNLVWYTARILGLPPLPTRMATTQRNRRD
ncbi:MAG: SemiSWEET family sugar transporter [Humibacter sp.]